MTRSGLMHRDPRTGEGARQVSGATGMVQMDMCHHDGGEIVRPYAQAREGLDHRGCGCGGAGLDQARSR